jgi:hypothetical protein
MNKITTILALIVIVLVIATLGIWTMVLLRGHAVASNAAPAPAGFFDYPAQPAYAPTAAFDMMIGKPMTVAPNTMICVDPADILAFWNGTYQAIKYGKDDDRRQAVETALAASCKITQGVTFGIIVADEPPSPATSDEYIVFKPQDGGDDNYWVQAASVSP